MKLLLDDGDEHVGRHGAPDLRLDRILAGAEEFLDAQMLLDPLEEQFHLPAAFVERRDGQGWQRRVVGEEDQGLAGIRILEANTTQVLGIVPGDVKTIHLNGRIYDPFVGRFLSADPEIQDPTHTQSYNRYTYVWNNPTNDTDPTGFNAALTDSQQAMADKIQGLVDSGTTVVLQGIDGEASQVVGNTQSGVNAAISKIGDNSNLTQMVGQGTTSFTVMSSGPATPAQPGIDPTAQGKPVSVADNTSGTPKEDLPNGKSGKDPNTRGSRAVEQVKVEMEAQGFTILGDQTPAKTEGLTYERRYDLLVKNPKDGVIYGVEVKSTISDAFKLNARQVAFDVATVKNTALTTDGRYVIQGVMYRGVQWTSGSPAAVWSTIVLNHILNSAQIPHELHGPPLP